MNKQLVMVIGAIAAMIGISTWLGFYANYEGQCWNWADQQFTAEMQKSQQPITDLDYYNICMKYNGMPGTTHDDLMSAPAIKIPEMNQTGQ